jgi:AcrR family transcriptional regulator
MTPTTPRGDRTRDEILEAATAVALESGPDSFSLREVARRAKLAPSALYNHYESRDALISAIALRALGEVKAYLGKAPEDGSAADRLRALGAAYSRFARERANEYRLIFDCLENPPTTWETYLAVAQPFMLIVDAVATGLSDGEFVDRTGVGPGGMAYGLWALVHGHASLTSRNLARVQGDFDALATAAIDSMLVGWAPASTTGGA